MSHRVVGVIGASGGVGTSTLAVALALRAARTVGAVACVDLVLGGGGLDVTACVEHLPGLRWEDLADASGRVDGADLLEALPAEGPTRVLAAGVHRRDVHDAPVRIVPPDPVVVECVSALSSVCSLTVLDLGASPRWTSLCTDVLLVTGLSARQLADAGALAAQLATAPAVGPVGRVAAPRLVVRTSRRDSVSPEEVAAHLDLPLSGVLPDDPKTVQDADRGRPPGSRAGGALGSAADRALRDCGLLAVPV